MVTEMKKLLRNLCKNIIVILLVMSSFSASAQGINFRTNTRILLWNNGFNFQDIVAYQRGKRFNFDKDRLKMEAFLDQEIFLANPAGVRLGFFYTREAFIDADGETVNYYLDGLYDDYNQNQYELDANLRDRSAYGLFLGDRIYTDEEEKLELFLRAKYIFGGGYHYNQMDGKLTGGLFFPVYSGERFQINTDKKHGKTQGFSFDMEGKWDVLQGSEVVLKGENIYSWIVWKNVYTRSMYGEEGEHYTSNYTGKFEPYYSLKFNHELFTLGVDHRKRFYPLGMINIKQDEQRVSFGRYGPLYTAELKTDSLFINLKSDQINLPDAYDLSVELGMNFAF